MGQGAADAITMALKAQGGRMVVVSQAPTNRFNAQNFHLGSQALFKLIAQPDKAPIEWVRLVRAHGLFFVSDSGSQYCTDGVRVWRYSDHWGRVASCLWYIKPAPISMTGSKVVSAWETAMKNGPLTGFMAWGPNPLAVIGVCEFSEMDRAKVRV